jgi:hypothetical protein
MDDRPAEEQQQGPHVSLGHLLMAMAFVIPVATVIGDLKRAGGGLLRYALGAMLGLALGSAIVWITWKVGRFLWLRFSDRSRKADTALAIGLYGLDICSMIAGLMGGGFLASLLTH